MAKRHLRASFALLVVLGLSTVGLVSQELACGTTAATREATALYLGVSSDMVVTDDFDSVGLFVSVKGEVKFSSVNGVKPGGTVALPGSLSILQPDDPATPVHIRVAGYKDGQVIAVRDAISTVPPNRISVLRLPIQWLSGGPKISGKQRTDTGTQQTGARVELRADPIGFEPNFPEFARFFDGLRVPCPTGQTSINGTCGPLDVTSLLVPTKGGDHVSEVFGGAIALNEKGVPAGGSCFPVADCFADAQTISMADLGADCSVPKTAIPTDQVNFGIRRTKSPGIPSTIPVDFVVDPALSTAPGWYEKGGRYMLPEAICDKEGRRDAVEAILVSTSCRNKKAAIPTCGPWSAVNDKAQKPPPAGPYFGSGTDAGLDAGARPWQASPIISVPRSLVEKPIGLALSATRAWVIGRAGQVAGYSLANPETDVLKFDAGPADRNFFPRIAARDTFVAASVVVQGNTAINLARYRETEPTSLTNPLITSPTGVRGGGVVVTGEGNAIFTFSETVTGQPQVVKLYAPGADAGVINTVLLSDQPVDTSFFAPSTLYISSGVRLFAVAAPDARAPGGSLSDLVAAEPQGPFNQGGKIFGSHPTAEFIYWPKESPVNGEIAILRSKVKPDPSASDTQPWVRGLSGAAIGVHDIPAIVGDATHVFFTDGKNIYGRLTTSGPVPVPPAPLFTVPNGDAVFGLAYRSDANGTGGILYAVTESGNLLGGPVRLP